jgi:hypothetical protein
VVQRNEELVSLISSDLWKNNSKGNEISGESEEGGGDTK